MDNIGSVIIVNGIYNLYKFLLIYFMYYIYMYVFQYWSFFT